MWSLFSILNRGFPTSGPQACINVWPVRNQAEQKRWAESKQRKLHLYLQLLVITRIATWALPPIGWVPAPSGNLMPDDLRFVLKVPTNGIMQYVSSNHLLFLSICLLKIYPHRSIFHFIYFNHCTFHCMNKIYLFTLLLFRIFCHLSCFKFYYYNQCCVNFFFLIPSAYVRFLVYKLRNGNAEMECQLIFNFSRCCQLALWSACTDNILVSKMPGFLFLYILANVVISQFWGLAFLMSMKGWMPFYMFFDHFSSL